LAVLQLACDKTKQMNPMLNNADVSCTESIQFEYASVTAYSFVVGFDPYCTRFYYY